MTTTLREIRDYPFAAEGADVPALYATLREREPVSRVRLPFGEPAWLVTRYADVRLVLDDARFSRAVAQGLNQPRLRREHTGDGIMGMDPPDHTRLRRLVGKAFTARRVEQLRAGVRRRAEELVEAMVRRSRPGDLVEDVARPLPTSVICDLLGVPYADHVRFREWTEALVGDATARADVLGEVGTALGAYIGELVARRREEPTDDLLGVLVRARDDGDRLTEDELIAIAGPGLLTGGVETVTAGLPAFVHTLLTRPDDLRLLREHPELMSTAVEELLRFVPINSAAMFARYALQDVQVGDTTVRRGDPVLAALAAANRDPAVFTDPERLDLTRRHNPHLTFGHGPHYCIGAQLARIELQEALGALLRRLPGLRHEGGPESVSWAFGVIVRGPSHLPVTW